MWQSALVTSFLLLGQVSAGVLGDAAYLVRRDRATEEKMRRYVDSIVEPIERRQSTTTTNVTEWDSQTMAACTNALEVLNGVANNPAGMAVCYNIPYLDNSTGVFQADLRLYTIASPTGDFANIASQNVQVGLSYVGATVSAVNGSTIMRRGEAVSLISWPKGKRQTGPVPVMAQAYAFVGQINQNLLSSNTTTLQQILVPMVTLSGKTPSGTTVNTTLSSDEATFVNGVFAATSSTTITKSVVAPPMQTLVVTGSNPFVLPGLNILIFPIGAIITGVWTVLFIGTIAYGTIGRMQFREQYRRRTARALKGDLARI